MCAQHTKRFSQMLGMSARLYYLIDAQGEKVQSVAFRAAQLLKGKSKPHFDDQVDMGDHVVIINTSRIDMRRREGVNRRVSFHTRYASGFKSVPEKTMHFKHPTLLVKLEVLKHLPRKNIMRRNRMERLHLYPNEDHPYWEQISHVLPKTATKSRPLEEYSVEEVRECPVLVDPRYSLLLPKHHELAPELMGTFDKWLAEREALVKKYFPGKVIHSEQ